jgi:putative phosphoribosyl transferase
LAIPRGGVAVGYEVAKSLNAEFSLIICRKLGFSHNPEAGFGAIAEDGSYVLLEGMGLSNNEIKSIKIEQKKEVKRRIEVLRHGKPFPDIRSKIVILVDDGLAMGVTMQAAVKMCKNKKAKKIVVAVPVSGKDVADRIRESVDELVVLEMPAMFYAVAQAYENWYDVTDEEVLDIMQK